MKETRELVTNTQRGEVTKLLERWNQGDDRAAEEIMPLVYDVLHQLAARYFRRERPDHTLQATAIVHDAYLALVENQPTVSWQNRAHFIGFMARVMRRILVDHARNRNYAKRGGRAEKVVLMEATQLSTQKPPDLVELDDALTSLGEIDAQKASLVELRFFGGLSIEEAAEVLKVSRATAIREWRKARAWLFRELSPAAP